MRRILDRRIRASGGLDNVCWLGFLVLFSWVWLPLALLGLLVAEVMHRCRYRRGERW